MSERIELRAGPTVDAEAIRLAIGLEYQGFELMVANGQIVVPRGHALTSTDRDAIRRLKPDLLTILAYRAPEPE